MANESYGLQEKIGSECQVMYKCKGRIPEMETSRLRLRKMRRKDAAQMFVHWSDREVTRYMNLAPMIGISEAADMIGLLNHMAGEEDAIRWGIELKATGNLSVAAASTPGSWKGRSAARSDMSWAVSIGDTGICPRLSQRSCPLVMRPWD